MSRDRFISDNLYSMRERFKQNHADRLPVPSSPEETPETVTVQTDSPSPQTETVPAAGTAPATAEKPRHLPSLTADSGDRETNRERRELEGRLLRDLSFIDTESALARQRTEAMERFRKVAAELLEELNAPELSSRRIDMLRIKYFQAYGSFEAALSRRDHSQGELLQAPAAPRSNWPMVTAMIVSAAIVSLTLLLLFGR